VRRRRALFVVARISLPQARLTKQSVGEELGVGERGVVVPRRSWMRFSVVDVDPWAKDRGTPTARDLTDVSDELVGASSTVQYTTIYILFSESITMALLEKLLIVLLEAICS
jgi:hypothetical protein